MRQQPKHTSQQILLQLISYALTGSHKNSPHIASTPDWQEIFTLAKRQGLSQLVWQGVERLTSEGKIASEQAPSRQVKLSWAYHNESLKERYNRQKHVIVKLASVLRSRNIELMVLKGYALSLCYATPERRECGDVDIWMRGDQRRGDEALKELLGVDIDSSKHHHTTFLLDGVMVENHYDFINVHSHASNRELERELKSLALEATAIEIEDVRIYIPNVRFHSLFLLRHTASHFAAAEISLRHIVDWAMFVERHHKEIDWQWLRATARRFNLELFLDTLNSLASRVCSTDLSLMPGTKRHEEMEERVIRDILTPEFSETKPTMGLYRILSFKLRRWWANRWKHKMVYSDSLASTFATQLWSHLLKPKSFK